MHLYSLYFEYKMLFWFGGWIHRGIEEKNLDIKRSLEATLVAINILFDDDVHVWSVEDFCQKIATDIYLALRKSCRIGETLQYK